MPRPLSTSIIPFGIHIFWCHLKVLLEYKSSVILCFTLYSTNHNLSCIYLTFFIKKSKFK